jgi:hypothetical protein
MGLLFPLIASIDLRLSDVDYRVLHSSMIQCATDVIRTYRGHIAVVNGAGTVSHALPTSRPNNN